jgi:hypothetical protein
MKAPSRMQFQDGRDARRGRLSDPVLLDIFMQARGIALREGQSSSMANESGHAAVEEKLKCSIPAEPKEPYPFPISPLPSH